jgi:hypothetical protein
MRLEGIVADQTGAKIAGAIVKVVAVDTGITNEKQANPNGYYRFPGLAVGSYTVTVSSGGFRTEIINDVFASRPSAHS